MISRLGRSINSRKNYATLAAIALAMSIVFGANLVRAEEGGGHGAAAVEIPENAVVRPPRPKPKIRTVPTNYQNPMIKPRANKVEQDGPKVKAVTGDGVDAILLLDTSASMKKTGAGELQLQSSKLFTRFLNPNDRIAVVAFDNGSRQVIPFTDASAANLAKIDAALSNILLEGTHTDFEAPVRQAFDLFLEANRIGTKKVVLLLSDGKFDPHPGRGTAQELKARLLDFNLPLLSRNGARVYTVSLTDDTDKSLMDQIALIGSGSHWVAKDVNTIHKYFSEMFLEVRRPGSSTNTQGLFVKEGLAEATFYITRSSEESVGLIDPRANIITNTTIPAGVKWFKGEDFDVVTVEKPTAGAWGLDKRVARSANAELLDNFSFELRSVSSASIGDQLKIAARFTNGGKPIDLAGFKKSSYVTYQITDSESGKKVAEGFLSDGNASGNFEANLTLATPGKLRVEATAMTPTFSRVSSYELEVSSGLLTVSEIRGKANEKPTVVSVKLGQRARSLADAELSLGFTNEETRKREDVKVELAETDEYLVSTKNFPPGKYVVSAQISGKSEDGTPISSDSDQITIEVFPVAVAKEVDAKEQRRKAKKAAPKMPEQEAMWPGVVSSLIAAIWVMAMFSFTKKRFGIEQLAGEIEHEPFELPGHVQRQIAALKEKSSSEKRELTEDELLIFSGLPLKESSDEKEQEQEVTSEDDSQAQESVAVPSEDDGKEKEAIVEEAVSAEDSPVVEESDQAEEVVLAEEALVESSEAIEQEEAILAVDAADELVEGPSDEELASIDRLVEEINAQS